MNEKKKKENCKTPTSKYTFLIQGLKKFNTKNTKKKHWPLSLFKNKKQMQHNITKYGEN